MRLTGGEGKGRKLVDPPPGVRPTSSRCRELVFQLLMARIEDARLLDLFSGTGALGIEALARGAEHATLVESDRRAQAVIRENLKRSGFVDRSRLVAGDVMRLLRQPGKLVGPFNIILADPPYADPVFTPLLTAIAENQLLAAGGILVFEAASRSSLTLPSGWVEVDLRRAGDTSLHFLEQDQTQ